MDNIQRTPRPSPEGPYEVGTSDLGPTQPRPDHLRFLDLIAELEELPQQIFDLTIEQRELRMILELVRSHYIGRIVTSSSLAAASGLSYGTAMRTMKNYAETRAHR